MCREYGWWKRETTAKRTTKESNPVVMRQRTPREDERADVAQEKKAEEKELVPAE